MISSRTDMKETPSTPKKDEDVCGDVERRASSNNDCSHCNADCSSCFKMTRTGRRYGRRCMCPFRDVKINFQPESVVLSDVFTDLSKSLMRWGGLVSLVLLVAVGLALTIHHFGQVSPVPHLKVEEHRWKLYNSKREAPRPAPSMKPLSVYRLFWRNGSRMPTEPQHRSRIPKAVLPFSARKGEEKNSSKSQAKNTYARALVLLPAAFFNVVVSTVIMFLIDAKRGG